MANPTGAGGYKDRVVILTRTLASADGSGEEVESWPDPAPGTGTHFANIEQPASGETADANRQSFNTFRIRFRHAVALEAVDRVRIKDTGNEYAITGVTRERAPWGGWQTVATVVG